MKDQQNTRFGVKASLVADKGIGRITTLEFVTRSLCRHHEYERSANRAEGGKVKRSDIKLIMDGNAIRFYKLDVKAIGRSQNKF